MEQAIMFAGADLSVVHRPFIRPAPLKNAGDYRLVTTTQELATVAHAIQHASGFVSFDTEFAGAGADVNVHRPGVQLVGLSIGLRQDSIVCWYIPLAHANYPHQLPHDMVRDTVAPLLQRAKTATHNGQIDISMLAYAGWGEIPVRFDTYAAAHALQWALEPAQAAHWASTTGKDPRHFFYLKKLKELAKRELGCTSVVSFKEVIARSRTSDFTHVDMADALAYVGQDADLTLQLAERLDPIMRASSANQMFHALTMPLLSVLSRMERRGVDIDPDHYERIIAHYTAQIETHNEALRDSLGTKVQWETDDQVRHLLYTYLGLPIKERTPQGKPAVGKNTVAELVSYVKEQWTPTTGFPHPQWPLPSKAHLTHVLRHLQERSKLTKLVTTYDMRSHVIQNHGTPKQYGTIHTRYNASGTSSGRKSSSSPNLQNMPAKGDGKDIRNGVIALNDSHTWHFVVADLSQIEPRCMAYLISLLGDRTFLDSYRENRDIYKTIGASALEKPYHDVGKLERDAAKTLFLALGYGSSAQGLASNTSIEALGLDVKGVERTLATLFRTIPGLKRYHWNAIAWGLYKGYTESLWGFSRPASDLRAERADIRKATARSMINHVIQSFAAQIMDAAMVWIDSLLQTYRLDHVIKLVLQVHDEVDSCVRDDYMAIAYAVMQKCMREVADIGAPLKIDVEVGRSDHEGSRWGDLIPFEQSEYGVQAPDTATIIAQIQHEQSPFLSMPLSDVTRPFDMTRVSDSDLAIYVWHAANLGIPLDDLRIPISDGMLVTGYITDIRAYVNDKGKRSYTTYRGTCVSRNVVTKLHSRCPLTEGLHQLYGEFQPAYGTFDVHSLAPLSLDLAIRDALRQGEPITRNGVTIHCDQLRAEIERAHLA